MVRLLKQTEVPSSKFEGKTERPARDRTFTPRWKAAVALSVAMLAVLWHLLACVESPMAFSPDGKTLALTVMDSSHGKLGSGDAVFRLMVISGREKLVVLEETSEKMLSAPTYTPDGKSLAYVRIPLPTKEQIDAIVQASKEGDEARDAQVAKLMALLQPKQKAASSPVTREAATAATAASASSAKLARQELPPINSMIDLVRNYYAGPEWPCEIVLRDAQSFEIRKVIPFRMHALSYTNKPLEGMATAYIFTQPQFSPNGGKIYIASGAEVVAVDLPGGETTLVAAPATLSILSPDGKTLAAVGEKYIAISHLDGDLTVWKHIPDAEALWSIAWMDNKTLGVVRKSGTGYALIGIGRDGRETVQIALPEDEKEIYSVARAKAGNMALTAGGKISLLDAKGKTVAKIPEITGQRGKLIVSNPTWSDDSKTLAVKLVEKGDKEEATVAVAFFDAAGKPIGRVAIPQAKRPASQPADVQPGRKGAAGSGKHLPGASAPSTSQADE